MTLAHALVYVIDDDMSMRKAIGRLLESEDYSVEMFMGAREFLARVAHTGPSRVILDLNMPGLRRWWEGDPRSRSFSLRAVPACRLLYRR
jgi:FixJ family two-component response regulator